MKKLNSQRGLSIIELMVGLLLSSLLLLGVLQVFDGNSASSRMQNAYARLQESGRFASDFLSREARMADYWGCAPDKSSIRNHLDPADSDYDSEVHGNFGADGVLGQDNVSGLTIGGMNVIDGTDVLELSGATDACRGTGRMVPSVTAAALHVTPSCNVVPGQIVLITNCQSGELFTVTNVQNGGGGDSGKKTIVHNTGVDDTDWVQNATKTLQREYGADAKVLVPYNHKFFIANSPVGTPSLYMSENGGTARELVPNIDDFQLLYGRDGNGDDVVDIWGPAVNDKALMEQVLALKFQLVPSSDNRVSAADQAITNLDGASTTYTDGKLRKVYTSAVKVRNRGEI
ncbi:PilW family protein [Biformimicrobium ophioploci]|uniref:PilW family protein n=1 Tax=Biformimicrobium ophioploci TaxID=3036711 RepID=A0ABQ6M2R3_9GAMM|nr:PilW family protein [Microbulbifer sp. NKW57]GMG88579.1 PilW family protein [Microbulbifer sp. NKW57]